MIHKTLVVNDDDLSLLIASKMLNKAKFSDEIVTAKNGAKALAYLSEIVSMGENYFDKAPGFIFLDLNMPVMNGWDFLAAFTAKYASLFPETKVVIMSAYTDREDIMELEKYKIVSDFICTPITLEKLEGIKKRHCISPGENSIVENHYLQVN